jgi:drug/metabolite transporter (DMT)-like permease
MSEIKSPIAKSKFSRGERQNIVSSYDYFLLFLLALIWGSSFMMQKIAVSEVAPITMTAWRQMIAAVLFVLILLFAKMRVKATAYEHFLLFMSAILGTALPFSLISYGVTQIDSGLAAILMGAMPLVTIVLAHFTSQDEPLNLTKLLAVGIGIFGLIVLFWPSLILGATDNVKAQTLVMLAAICYAVNSIITKKIIHLEAPIVMAIIVLWSVVILVPAALMFENQTWTMPGIEVSAAIVVLAVFPTLVAAFLMYEVIGRQGAGFFSQINLLVPISGVFMGLIFLGERLSWNAWAALAIILCGVAVSRRWNSTRKADINPVKSNH